MKRLILLACAWVSFGLGVLGVFVPLLPTTPFILLATFLFSKSSTRWHTWVKSTRVYKNYVEAFFEAGGIPPATKARILLISFTVLGISAFMVQQPLAWGILICVAIGLLYLFLVRIPTVGVNEVYEARQAQRPEAEGD